jgi:hypothetical protein
MISSPLYLKGRGLLYAAQGSLNYDLVALQLGLSYMAGKAPH